MGRWRLAVLLLALAAPALAQQNPLLPQIRPLQPGEKAPEAKPEPAPEPEQPAQPITRADGMPVVSVRASRVEIKSVEGITNVYFDLNWSIAGVTEPVLEVEGDLLLSDDEGQVHGRVPWVLKDPNASNDPNDPNGPIALPPRFDERNVGIDTSKSSTAHAWFKGAQPSWIRFGFLARRATFVSGRKAECGDCK
jgi:hypothetical protein